MSKQFLNGADLGVAICTTLNKVTFTTPANGSTITVADGKTFTSSNTLTLTGTDNSTLAIGTGGTLGSAAYTASSSYEAALGNPAGNGYVLSSTTGGARSWIAAAGTGTVTTVSVTTANGVSGSVANATTTPAITLTLGAITPSTVAATSVITAAGSFGASSASATPSLLAMDGTYGNTTAGKNFKIKMYQDSGGATTAFGFGVASSSMEYTSGSSGAHNFYVNGATPTLLMTLSTAGALTTKAGVVCTTLAASSVITATGLTTGSGSSTPSLIASDGTYGTTTAGKNFKIKTYRQTDSNNDYGIGVAANSFEYVSGSGAAHNWYVNGSTPTLLASLSTAGLLSTTAGIKVGGGTTVNSIYSAVKSSFDCPSIAANGGVQTTTVTVTGATTTSTTQVSLPSGGINNGVIVDAYVSSANTVTLRFTNCTTGAIDPAIASYRVTVMNF